MYKQNNPPPKKKKNPTLTSKFLFQGEGVSFVFYFIPFQCPKNLFCEGRGRRILYTSHFI
jgi:hypothetical protein